MKKILLLFFIASLQSFTTNHNSSTFERKNFCIKTKIEIIDDKNYKLDIAKSKIIGVQTIVKRNGIYRYEDLTEKEKKRLLKKAKKLKSCKILCDFDYETPKQLKNIDYEKENNKKNYFHFYFIQDLKE